MISLERIKERKLVQWALAYLAAAWLVLQVLDLLGDAFGWPADVHQIAIVLLAVGFLAALVLAWYHGEKGQQRVSGLEALLLAGILLFAGAAVALVQGGEDHTSEVHAGGAGDSELTRQRVLVAAFENRTGDPALDQLGNMAANWITEGLSQTGLVEVVDATTAFSASLVADSAAHGNARVRGLAERTGAGTLVWGAYYKVGDSIQFQAQITDAAGGRLLRAVEPVTGSAERPVELVQALRGRVMAVLANAFDKRLASWADAGMASGAPLSYEAYREFADGLERFLRQDYPAAIEHLQRADALDSTSAMPLRWAANAYTNQGQSAATDSLLQVVRRRRERLSTAERHWLDWTTAGLEGDLFGALDAARRLTELSPRFELAQFGRALYALRVNHPRESLAAFSHVSRSGIFGEWPLFWLSSAAAHHVLGEHQKELEHVREGRRHLPGSLPLLQAEVRALAALGKEREVLELLTESISQTSGSGTDPGVVMETAVLELRAHGRPEAAEVALRRALEWSEAQPLAARQSAAGRYLKARLFALSGRNREAQALLEMLAREAPENPDYRGQLGVLAARRGDRGEAELIAAELERLSTPYLRGRNTAWRARIAAVLGQREHAVQLLSTALRQGFQYGVGWHSDPNLEPLRGYPPFHELLRPKG